MIQYELIQSEGILIVSPVGPLAASDFQKLSEEIDPYIEARGRLHGLLIDANKFSGWDDFAGLIDHLKFVESHHKKNEKVAVLSDDRFLSAVPTFADHFIQAEIKHFPHSEKEEALRWLKVATKTLS
ncbi:STAS/SEC14 domain-containing protein [Gimesia sp.]|uniref:STAS/SEC14 domain-containing protein n=1 Tax=Gimesia sp. TaxID=2024833 RepID=UPI0032EF25D9